MANGDNNEWVCTRCNDEDNGGFTLPDGEYVCSDCLTEPEKAELGEFWSGLEE